LRKSRDYSTSRDVSTWVRRDGDDNRCMNDQDPFGMSAFYIAASVGTVLLVGLAALALYGVGIVLA
jgi:hypothetical protein